MAMLFHKVGERRDDEYEDQDQIYDTKAYRWDEVGEMRQKDNLK